MITFKRAITKQWLIAFGGVFLAGVAAYLITAPRYEGYEDSACLKCALSRSVSFRALGWLTYSKTVTYESTVLSKVIGPWSSSPCNHQWFLYMGCHTSDLPFGGGDSARLGGGFLVEMIIGHDDIAQEVENLHKTQPQLARELIKKLLSVASYREADKRTKVIAHYLFDYPRPPLVDFFRTQLSSL